MIPPNINKEDVLAAIKRIDSEGIHADRHLIVYVSSNDRALLMSRVVNRGRRLGESTLDPRNPDQFEEAARIFDLVEPEDGLSLW